MLPESSVKIRTKFFIFDLYLIFRASIPFSSLDSSSLMFTIKAYLLLLQFVKVFNFVFDKGLLIKVLFVWEITLPSSWIKFN